MSRPHWDHQFKELGWEKRDRLSRKKGHKQMSGCQTYTLHQILQIVERMSTRLDDIASRLPIPASENPSGEGLDKYYDQGAYKREGTGDGNFKYPTTYVSASTKTTGSTND